MTATNVAHARWMVAAVKHSKIEQGPDEWEGLWYRGEVEAGSETHREEMKTKIAGPPHAHEVKCVAVVRNEVEQRPKVKDVIPRVAMVGKGVCLAHEGELQQSGESETAWV